MDLWGFLAWQVSSDAEPPVLHFGNEAVGAAA